MSKATIALAGLLVIVICPSTSQGVRFLEVAKLTASDGQTGDWFGAALAFDGDTAVVGAREHSHSGVGSSGGAYVFQRDQGGIGAWGEVAELVPSDLGAGDDFGTSVAISGDTVAVGTRRDDDLGGDSGAVYIFERDAGGADNWGEVAKLTASDGVAGDEFGGVSLEGDTLAVGAIGDDDGGSVSGSAYIFYRDELNPYVWTETAKLAPSDPQAGAWFGGGVAVSGDTVAVAADHRDSSRGAAYIFERNAGGPDMWGQVAKLLPADVRPGDFFGARLSLDSDILAVPSPFHDQPLTDAGAVYVFLRDADGPDMWGQVAKLSSSDVASGDAFGSSTSVDGDTIVISASRDDDLGSSSGSIYLFQREAADIDVWNEVSKATASDGAAGDLFGTTVRVSGQTATVSAYLNDSRGDDSGSAYVFQLRDGLSLSITGTCPGEVIINVSTPDPDQRLRLYAGPREGTSYVVSGPCLGGTELDIAFARNWRSLTTDGNGEGSLARSASSAWCGRYLQALDRQCAVSNVAQFP